jgi:hypothetical protein
MAIGIIIIIIIIIIIAGNNFKGAVSTSKLTVSAEMAGKHLGTT